MSNQPIRVAYLATSRIYEKILSRSTQYYHNLPTSCKSKTASPLQRTRRGGRDEEEPRRQALQSRQASVQGRVAQTGMLPDDHGFIDVCKKFDLR
jgi:hypothetical protein